MFRNYFVPLKAILLQKAGYKYKISNLNKLINKRLRICLNLQFITIISYAL